jgi:hypothetical protein
MKLKLPFFNRQRYIVLTAITESKALYNFAPAAKSTKYIPNFRKNSSEDFTGFVRPSKPDPSFKSCYGFIKSLKSSATIPCPADFTVISSKDNISVDTPAPGAQLSIEFGHNDDLAWRPKDTHIIKLVMPWIFQCSVKGMHFVTSSHILNDTWTRIPSGIVNFDISVDNNLFNYVPKQDLQYKVPFGTPLVWMHPISDLPLQVETVYDPQLFFNLLQENSFRPFTSHKLQKLLKKTY